LSSCPLYKIYKTITLPVVLYGCETSSTLRKERGLRVSENRVLRRILDLRRRKWQEAREDCIMRSFITGMLHKISLR
jgi:hypothetical protein